MCSFATLRIAAITALVLCLTPAIVLAANEWFASPTGSPSGDGSIGNPWDLTTALHKTSTIKPGDTLWLRGGTYAQTLRAQDANDNVQGTKFGVNLQGTAAEQIIIRNYNGERATIDGGIGRYDNNTGRYFTLWGLEVMVSELAAMPGIRTSKQSGGNITDLPGPHGGIVIRGGNGIHVVNNIVHDNRGGVHMWGSVGDNSSIYGNVLFENGWVGTDRPHGQGIYTQNNLGANDVRRIANNFMLRNYSLPMQAYSSANGNAVHNFLVEKNIVHFNPDTNGQKYLLIGGEAASHDLHARNNFFYNADLRMGWSYTNPTGTNPSSNLSAIGNRIFRGVLTITQEFRNAGIVEQDNIVRNSGTTPEIFIERNEYELNRYHIAIVKWTGSSVAVDMTGIMDIYDTYRLLDPMNFWGTPLAEGTYMGGNLIINQPGEFGTYILYVGPAIPEPASAALLGVTALLLGSRSLRRKPRH